MTTPAAQLARRATLCLEGERRWRGRLASDQLREITRDVLTEAAATELGISANEIPAAVDAAIAAATDDELKSRAPGAGAGDQPKAPFSGDGD